MGQVFVLGGAPNSVEQPQNALERVSNCACTSRPITGSNSTVISAEILREEKRVATASYVIAEKQNYKTAGNFPDLGSQMPQIHTAMVSASGSDWFNWAKERLLAQPSVPEVSSLSPVAFPLRPVQLPAPQPEYAAPERMGDNRSNNTAGRCARCRDVVSGSKTEA